MRAVTLHEGVLQVDEVPRPTPGPGQVLIRITRSGICGSDLHARFHADASADIAAEVGYDDFARRDATVVLGHEFTGEVVDYGPQTRRRWKAGTPVVTLPLILHDGEVHMTGLSVRAPGGYAEYALVAEDATMAVPRGVSPDLAALTEPLAVAYHAVRRGTVRKSDVCVVIGCGPIGLAVVLMLKAAGVRTVIASDYSAPRRELAQRCGADVVVDPAVTSPWEVANGLGDHVTTATGLFGTALQALHALRASPVTPWAAVLRTAKRFGVGPRGPVVFECVGLPGVIEDISTKAPFLSTIVVVGVCMVPDSFRPTMAINKEHEFRFCFCYDPAEFHDTIRMVARGRIDPSPLVTAVIGLDSVADAFDRLGKSPAHAKVLIDPRGSGTLA